MRRCDIWSIERVYWTDEHLPTFSAELSEKTSVVGEDELLHKSPVIVKLEDIDQIHLHALACRGKRAGRRHRKLVYESAFYPSLASDVVSLDDHDPPPD